jgi:GTP pyrophosphokinase
VHRTDCPNIAGLEYDRRIDAQWADALSGEFVAHLSIHTDNKKGIIAAITSLISKNKINIVSVNAKTTDSDGIIKLSLELPDTETLDYIMTKINGLRGVYNVRRG